LEGQGQNGGTYQSFSIFKVIKAQEIAQFIQQDVQQKQISNEVQNSNVNVQDLEFSYPEYSANNDSSAVKTATEPQAPVSGAPLTRARLTELLAQKGVLKISKVNAAPASDVAITHPNVRTIKSGIVSGIVPNLSKGKFYPDKYVTGQQALQILKAAKLKIMLDNTKITGDYISEQQFQDWLDRSKK